MIVDYLTFTFAEEREDKLADLVKKIDPGAVAVETKSGYAEYWSLWGSGWLKWGYQREVLAHLLLPDSTLALYRESGGDIGTLIYASRIEFTGFCRRMTCKARLRG